MEDLKKIRQQKAFLLPDDYFNEFEEKIMETLSPQPYRENISWLDRLIYQLQPRFSIPTIFVFSLAFLILYIQLDQKEEPAVFSDGEILDYLLENLDDHTEESLYALAFPSDDKNVSISDADLLEYLYESEIDDELLEEYLP